MLVFFMEIDVSIIFLVEILKIIGLFILRFENIVIIYIVYLKWFYLYIYLNFFIILFLDFLF